MIKCFNPLLSTFETNSRFQYVLLTLIILLATLLRFYKLGEWSFWIDEIFTINRIRAHVNLETIIAQWWQPSLSLILTGGVLRVSPLSEWSTRLVPAIIGIISIPLLFFPIKRVFGVGVAFVAILLLAVSPWHLYWSQNARFYTSLLLFYTLASFAFFFGLERDRPGYILLFLGLLFLAMGERLIALFLAPVLGGYLLLLKTGLFEQPPGLRARNLFLILLAGIAFGLFEIYRFMTTGSSHFAHAFDTFGGNSNHSSLRLLLAIIFQLGIPVVCLGFFGGIYLLTEKDRAGLFVFIAALLPSLLLVMLAPFMFTVDRYVFVTLPFWAILSAVTLWKMLTQAEKRGKLLALGVLTLVLAISLGQDMLYYEFQHGNRPNWRRAFAIVNQRKANDDLIFATRPELGHYYLGDEVKPINGSDPEAVAFGNYRAWFVIDEATGWVEPALRQWIQENSALVDIVEVNMPGKSLNIRIYLYNPLGQIESHPYRALYFSATP